MHLLKLAWTAIALLVATLVFSQNFKKGFLLQANGDTLYGLIRNTSYEALSQSIEFKTSRKATAQHFSAAELLAFGFRDGDYFASQPVRFTVKKGDGWQEIMGQRFLFRLETGELSLFELRDGQEAPLFVKKQGQPLQLLCFDKDGQPEFRKVLRASVADCGQLVFPEKIKLDPAAVQSLIEDYNNCKDLGRHLSLPFVQAWGFGSLSVMSLVKEYGGMGRGLAAEVRLFKQGFASRWTLGADYENQSYRREDSYFYGDVRLHEAGLKARFFLPAGKARFCPYGLLGTKLRWKKSETGYTLEDGQQYIDKVLKDRYWQFQVGVGVHAQFGRHLFRLEVPFDQEVNLRLGYGIALWK
ncbi:MAG: hypothetical protein H6577_04925 [Lewinellaceae bacterium]|nr:hypothetical protein [Saprospiraceae bacterium]MCB9337447.1 hypothetical protein [Lewinellaceae bacterium]